MKETKQQVIVQNKKAHFDYEIIDTYEAGIVLYGTEIKSVRDGHVSMQDSYCEIINGEMFVRGLHIAKYEMGNIFNHDPDRNKKLLLHKQEIIRLKAKKAEDGFTIIPLKVLLKNGLCKVIIGVCRGKKTYDKREDLKKADQLRYVEKLIKGK